MGMLLWLTCRAVHGQQESGQMLTAVLDPHGGVMRKGSEVHDAHPLSLLVWHVFHCSSTSDLKLVTEFVIGVAL